MLKLACTLDPKFHEKGKPSWLVVFLPRHLLREQRNLKCVTGEQVLVQLPVPEHVVEEDAQLHVWWYAHRELLGDDNTDSDKFTAAAAAHVDFENKSAAAGATQAQPYTARCGVASVALKELVERQRCEVLVSDAVHDCVATLTVELRADPGLKFGPVHHRQSECDDKWFAGCAEQYAAALSAVHAEIKATNLTELPRHEFAGIVQEIGVVPIWVWVFANSWWEEQKRDTRGDSKRFKQLLAIAEPLTGRSSDSKLRDCELLNEVLTLQTRATLYVLDTSMGRHRHDNSVDDWTNMRHNPALFEAGADCEDLALEILRESHALRRCQTPLGKLLASEYMSCMAIVTLRLAPSHYTYHAITVQVPRRWLLGGSAGSLPPILHEGTSYTTGAWQFDTPDCTQQQFDDAHIQWPVESICKVPAQQVRAPKACPYGHVVSLFCPELLESKGVAQVELSYMGAQGAPIHAFMRCDAAIKMHRVEAPRNWQALVRYLVMHLPLPIHFHDTEEEGELPLPVRDGAFHCLFRGVDFNDAVRERLLSRMHGSDKELQTRRIVLPGSGSVLVQCISVGGGSSVVSA